MDDALLEFAKLYRNAELKVRAGQLGELFDDCPADGSGPVPTAELLESARGSRSDTPTLSGVRSNGNDR